MREIYLSTVLTSSLLCIHAGRRSSVNCLGNENDMQHKNTHTHKLKTDTLEALSREKKLKKKQKNAKK